MVISENYPLYIGGNWMDKKEKVDVVNSATEEVIAQVPNAGPEEMKQAIEAVVRIQSDWADTVASERARILVDAARLMRERTETLDTFGFFRKPLKK